MGKGSGSFIRNNNDEAAHARLATAASPGVTQRCSLLYKPGSDEDALYKRKVREALLITTHAQVVEAFISTSRHAYAHTYIGVCVGVM